MAVGIRKEFEPGKYSDDPLFKLASEFKNVAKNILSENAMDYLSNPKTALMLDSVKDTLKEFFINESIDPDLVVNDPEAYDAHMENMEEIFTNDIEGLNEYAELGAFNPVIGLMFPLHKNMLMNCVYNQFLPTEVARAPKFTITMEDRFLVTADGEEIDMFKEQHRIYEAMERTVPNKEVEVFLPENMTTDIIEAIGGSSLDHLSITTHISAVRVEVTADSEDEEKGIVAGKDETENGGTNETGKFFQWIPVDIQLKPGYNDQYERSTITNLNFEKVEKLKGEIKDDTIAAGMSKDRFIVNSFKGVISKVKIKAKIDSSNGLTKTCSVKWKSRTQLEEIPEATPISVAISPEEVKDIAALYHDNQLTKVMSMVNDVLINNKDDGIKHKLDHSFLTMDPNSRRIGKFDFEPRSGYALDNVEWRYKTFFDTLDTFATQMLNILNDPNMTISVLGRPDIIRKITPTEYSYQAPPNIGPVELNFNKTVVTSDRRVYNFMSSQKLNRTEDNNLVITLHPRNTNRIVYKIYDYQMYMSNEIRKVDYHTLPAVTAFERWHFVQHQPIQGRIEILNPDGLLIKG